jgi:membrane protein DedA with SNARE-associated domain
MIYSWWFLFIGAFLDAFIGINLFFHGEPFFIGAGYLLHKGNSIGLLSVYMGGFIGDQFSYFIGKKYGKNGIEKLKNKFPKTRKGFVILKKQLRKRGLFVITGSRLLGPVAWVTPFFAGANNIHWFKFTLYSTFGLILGVGQFIFAGYLLSAGLDNFPFLNESKIIFYEHIDLIVFSTIAFVSILFILIKTKGSMKKLISSFLVLLLCFGLLNFTHFFVRGSIAPKLENIQIEDLSKLNFLVYAGKSAYYEPQPINLIYVGDHPRELMNDLNWIKNKTFSKDKISLVEYLKLMKNKTPPVSDLFWNNSPQYSAYQEEGDLINRNHLRWWHAGQYKGESLWVGAVSYDNEVEVSLYKGIVTLLHDIDRDVDKERNKLKKRIKEINGYKTVLKPLGKPNKISEDLEFNTDGKILFISKEKFKSDK